MSSDGPYWPDGFFAELVELAEAGDLQDDLNVERLDAMYQRAAEELTRPVIENPARALAEERGQRAGFEARLAARWGRPLDLFDLTVEQALEAGRWINTRWRPRAAARQDKKFEALIRLHGRAVMTANEVQVLLRSGYSTGALARWRTPHEIWVVSSVLGDHDQEVSRRYLVHNAVESMKGEEEYEETWEALGFEPPDCTSAKRDERRASLRDDFGEPFLRDYGWAAPLFGDRAPKFLPVRRVLHISRSAAHAGTGHHVAREGSCQQGRGNEPDHASTSARSLMPRPITRFRRWSAAQVAGASSPVPAIAGDLLGVSGSRRRHHVSAPS